jgi:hypothetical protein
MGGSLRLSCLFPASGTMEVSEAFQMERARYRSINTPQERPATSDSPKPVQPAIPRGNRAEEEGAEMSQAEQAINDSRVKTRRASGRSVRCRDDVKPGDGNDGLERGVEDNRPEKDV